MMALLLVFVLLSSGQTFASSNVQADSESPVLSPFTIFNPNFQYLDDGSSHLSYLGDLKVNIWGQTLGTRKVDTIGVQVTLQRWTGSLWTDVNTGANSTYTNDSYAYASRDVTVMSGYYYRTKSRHWIIYDGEREEGTVYSNSLLIP